MNINTLRTYAVIDGIETFKLFCMSCDKVGLVIENEKMCCKSKPTETECLIQWPTSPMTSDLKLSSFFHRITGLPIEVEAAFPSMKTDDKQTILNEWLHRTKPLPKERPKTSSIGHIGWVYFLHIGGEKVYKIGITSDIDTRVKDLRQTHFRRLRLPDGIKPNVYVVKAIKIKSPRIHEQALHALYAHRRLYGEYFTLTKTDSKSVLKLMELIERREAK